MFRCICTCGETISDKIDYVRAKYTFTDADPSIELYNKVMDDLHVENMCTRIALLTAMIMPDDAIDVAYADKIKRLVYTMTDAATNDRVPSSTA